MARSSNAAKTKTGTKTGTKAGTKTGAKPGGKPGTKPEERIVKTTSAPAQASAGWRGDAVAAAGPVGQSAEEAAARAEGNAPLPAEAVANGEDRGTFPDQGPRRQPASGADDAENAEEKRQSAAEDHAREPFRGPIHGRL